MAMLTVTTAGAGTVTSTPAGIDCGATCQAGFAMATTVVLAAAPAAGGSFSGWTGACSGQGTCSFTLIADTSVGATFSPPPPPPPAPTFTLHLELKGSGVVRSTTGSVDCDRTCDGVFAPGTRLALVAAADAGWTFSGWSAPHCAGTAECDVILNGDVSLEAEFKQTAPPPPPPDECAGLVPAALPQPVVASLPDSDCLGGTSDDGTGNYLLGYMAGADIRFPVYLFFTVEGGQARTVGQRIVGGDESATFVFSQPSGFTSFNISGITGGSTLSSFTHDGARISSQPVVQSSFETVDDVGGSTVAIDPSGGTAAVRTVKDAHGAWMTSYRRFDKTGAPEMDWVSLGSSPTRTGPGIAGVALSGNVLRLLAVSPSSWQASWYTRSGRQITSWFGPVPGSGSPELKFLLDGSLALRFRAPNFPFAEGPWVGRFEDGKEAMSPAPEWLTQRGANSLFAVRNGRAYASWGGARQCGSNLEVVSASTGESCGCLAVPNLRNKASVGRDGSLIVARPEPSPDKCQYDLYPQLFK